MIPTSQYYENLAAQVGARFGAQLTRVPSIVGVLTADNVIELDALTCDGVRLQLVPTSDDEARAIAREPGRRGEIYQGLLALRDRHAGEIRARYPPIRRRVSAVPAGSLAIVTSGNGGRGSELSSRRTSARTAPGWPRARCRR